MENPIRSITDSLAAIFGWLIWPLFRVMFRPIGKLAEVIRRFWK